MRSWALATFVAGLVAFIAFVAVPFLTEERTFPAAITSPPPLQAVSIDPIPPGSRLCMRDIAVERHSDLALIKVGTFKRPGPPLVMTIDGRRGYAARDRIAGGYPDNTVQAFELDPPARAQLATVCVTNDGRRRVALYAAADRAQSRAVVTLDGRRVNPTPQLAFQEEGSHSFADRAATTVGRLAAFRGPLGYAWVVGVVLALLALAAPLAVGLAVWLGLARDRSDVRRRRRGRRRCG